MLFWQAPRQVAQKSTTKMVLSFPSSRLTGFPLIHLAILRGGAGSPTFSSARSHPQNTPIAVQAKRARIMLGSLSLQGSHPDIPEFDAVPVAEEPEEAGASSEARVGFEDL